MRIQYLIIYHTKTMKMKKKTKLMISLLPGYDKLSTEKSASDPRSYPQNR